MRTTKHATVQQQRRGIESARVEMVLDYGQELKATRHARMYRISRKELLFVESECPTALWRRYRDYLNKTVPVVAGNDAVLTSMNRYRRIWRLK